MDQTIVRYRQVRTNTGVTWSVPVYAPVLTLEQMIARDNMIADQHAERELLRSLFSPD